MKTSKNGIELIKKFEGCKLNAYEDVVGIWTIGYGATYYINGNKVKEKDYITQKQADDLLAFHLQEFEGYVYKFIKKEIKLNQNQFDALVSLCFNVGPGNLRKSTLIKELNEGDEIIELHFTSFAFSKGKFNQGLANRRIEEYKLFSKKI